MLYNVDGANQDRFCKQFSTNIFLHVLHLTICSVNHDRPTCVLGSDLTLSSHALVNKVQNGTLNRETIWIIEIHMEQLLRYHQHYLLIKTITIKIKNKISSFSSWWTLCGAVLGPLPECLRVPPRYKLQTTHLLRNSPHRSLLVSGPGKGF